jgi:hypothetical protein
MNRATFALAALGIAIAFPASCGGSVSNSENVDGGADATSSSSSGGSGGSGSSSGSGDTCGAQGESCCNGTACNNGLMCSGGQCLGSSSSSSGSGGSGGGDGGGSSTDATLPPLDAALPPLDAALASLDAAPAGVAGFAFIVNDVVQHPMACPGADWEFLPYPGTDGSGAGCIPCPGIQSVVLVNTGSLDMAYIAGPWWSGQNYVPGGYPGGQFGAGVLAPGAFVDITAFYNTGDVAIVGSAEPFSAQDAAYASDEGIIPWPVGVAGSGGATNMYVAEIEVRTSCSSVQQNW